MRDARRRWAVTLAAISVAALALRLTYLAELRHTPFFSVLVVDGQAYDAWAQRIAGGQWLGSEVFYQTPLYPYLLACVYAIAGHHVLLVRLLQAALGASSCALLGIAGRHFVGPTAGLIAALLLAIYPEAIFWDGLVQKSSLDLFLMTLLLVALGASAARPRPIWLAAAGMVMGAFILNRENAATLYPVVVLWLLGAFRAVPLRRRLIWAALVTACVAVVLVPVGVRNAAVGGGFFLTTAQLGPNFYIGNHSGAHGVYDPLVPGHGNPLDERDDATALAERATGRRLSPRDVSDYWIGRAVDDIRRQPLTWVRLLGRKALLIVNAGELVDTESMREYSEFSRVLRTLRWLDAGVVLPLAVLGIWVTRSAWRSLLVCYAAAAGLALSVVLFYVVSRYRYPILPVVLLFAAAALAALPRVRIAWRSWLSGAMGAAGMAVVSHLPMTSVSNTTYDNVGAELIRQGRPREAVPVLQRAVAIVPDDARARFDLGVAFGRIGDQGRALAELATAIRIRPDFAEAHDALGSALRAGGRRDEARDQFAEAVRLAPGSAQARLNYGVALWESGARDAAIGEYRAAARIRPDDAAAHNDLAAALQQTGHTREAIPEYEAALAIAPDYAEAHSNLALALGEIGRGEDAADHFRAALRLQPASFGVHANFGDLLLRLGRTSDAIREFQDAVRLSPDDVDTRLTLLNRLAQAYLAAHATTDAIDTLTRAMTVARAAGRDELAAQLARALRAAGR